MGFQTIRPSVGILVLGLLFVFIPLCFFTGPAVYHLATGTPMMFSNGKYTTGSHVGTNSEMLTMALLPLIHVTVGVFAILFYKNAVLKVDKYGLAMHNLLGRVKCRFDWKSVDRVQQRRGQKGSTYFEVTAAGEKHRLSGYKPQDIEQMLRYFIPDKYPLA